MTDYTFPESNINAGWLARFPHYKLCIDTPRVDSFSDGECDAMRDGDEEYLTKCCMKLLPAMFNEEFPNHWEHHAFDEMVGAAQVALVEAVRSWNPARGASLATWVWRLARRAAVQARDDQQRYDALHLGVLDDMDSDSVYEGEWLDDNGDAEAAMEAAATIQMLKRKLGSIDGKILDMMVEGYTQAEIAALLGVSQPTASRRIAAIEVYIRENG